MEHWVEEFDPFMNLLSDNLLGLLENIIDVLGPVPGFKWLEEMPEMGNYRGDDKAKSHWLQQCHAAPQVCDAERCGEGLNLYL